MEHAAEASCWPDLMTFADGEPVKTAEDWAARREEFWRYTGKTYTGVFRTRRGKKCGGHWKRTPRFRRKS